MSQAYRRNSKGFESEYWVVTLFQNPTIENLARLIFHTGECPPPSSIPVFPRNGSNDVPSFPTSFAQEQLWLKNQMDPGSRSYNISLSVKISGHLNLQALERAIDELSRRHEPLRTVFCLKNGVPAQVILVDSKIALDFHFLNNLALEQKELAAEKICAASTALPFDLGQGPLARMNLIQVEAGSHLLHVSVHHISMDGWSASLLFRDLFLFYRSFCERSSALLPLLPIQFTDFAVWQRQALTNSIIASRVSYWRKELAQTPFLLVMEKFPLGVYGKIDRQALPLWSPEAVTEINSDFPSTQVELQLVRIWERILKTEQIGVTQSFQFASCGPVDQ